MLSATPLPTCSKTTSWPPVALQGFSSHWITPQIFWAKAGLLPTSATSTTAAMATIIAIFFFFLACIFLLLPEEGTLLAPIMCPPLGLTDSLAHHIISSIRGSAHPPNTHPLLALIHRRAWKGNSPKLNFALHAFSEVASALLTLHTGCVDQL